MIRLSEASVRYLRWMRVGMAFVSLVRLTLACALVAGFAAYLANAFLHPGDGAPAVPTVLAVLGSFNGLLGWQGLRSAAPLWTGLGVGTADEALERSLRHQARFWTVWGGLAVALTVLVVVVALIVAVRSRV